MSTKVELGQIKMLILIEQMKSRNMVLCKGRINNEIQNS